MYTRTLMCLYGMWTLTNDALCAAHQTRIQYHIARHSHSLYIHIYFRCVWTVHSFDIISHSVILATNNVGSSCAGVIVICFQLPGKICACITYSPMAHTHTPKYICDGRHVRASHHTSDMLNIFGLVFWCCKVVNTDLELICPCWFVNGAPPDKWTW